MNELKDKNLLKSEDEINFPPLNKTLSEKKKLPYALKADRCVIDFDKELQSLQNHSEIIMRPRLSTISNNVYIQKFKVKSKASYIYAGETDENYRNY